MPAKAVYLNQVHQILPNFLDALFESDRSEVSTVIRQILRLSSVSIYVSLYIFFLHYLFIFEPLSSQIQFLFKILFSFIKIKSIFYSNVLNETSIEPIGSSAPSWTVANWESENLLKFLLKGLSRDSLL